MEQQCIYCSAPADSLEHPLPVAFGEFVGAPHLLDRICRECNNTRLGVLDEQLARCGPEAFLRRHYGVSGRPTHEPVNPFYRGSAGGHRIEMKAYDEQLGCDVLMECEAGEYRQVRQLIFIEESGRSQQLPIREGTTPEQLRTAYQKLGIQQPVDVRVLCDDHEKEWVEQLLTATSPSVTFAWNRVVGSATYNGAVGTFVMTNRYFRAIAKVAFHYFLTQFPEYAGSEQLFANIREFILDETSTVDRANQFIGKRQLPLLGGMMKPGTRPAGWQAHLLAAEIKNGAAVAHVQMFISEDWPATAYTIALGHNSLLLDRAAGHLYAYYQDGPHGIFAGEVHELSTTKTNLVAPLLPAITKA